MKNTWFTSDLHFGHQNILEYEKDARPFKTLEEMHETLINNWNMVVNKNDIVYVLGDFAFGRDNISIAARLHGRKRLILGNHDTYPGHLYLDHFEKLFGIYFWKRCILSHAPVHSSSLGTRWFLNVHGHLHSRNVTRDVMDIYNVQTSEGPMQMLRADFFRKVEDENYFNVAVEQNNLTPFHSDQIIERLKLIDKD